MSLPIVDIAISDEAVIPCPAINFNNRRAYKSCPNCAHFNGVVKKGDNGDWIADYAILCGHPIERNTFRMPEVIED